MRTIVHIGGSPETDTAVMLDRIETVGPVQGLPGGGARFVIGLASRETLTATSDDAGACKQMRNTLIKAMEGQP